MRPSTSALYYPHTTIRDPRLIKNALLLWDTVDCISPQPGFTSYRHHHPVNSEALEIIVRNRIPSVAEMRKAHQSIHRLVDSEYAKKLVLPMFPIGLRRQQYGIHPAKLLDETWRALERGGFAMFDEFNPHDPRVGEYWVTPEMGLLMMSALADACAGARLRRITDRAPAYAALTQYIGSLAGGEFVSNLDASQVGPAYDRLITISLRVLNTDDISIERLVALRRREQREGGRDLARLREKYLAHIDEYVDKLASVAVSYRDKLDIEREFQKAVEDDLRDLQRELDVELSKLFTKEIMVAAVAAAGALVAHLSGVTDVAVSAPGIAGVVPLVANAVRYRAGREKALESHTMSWLYKVT